MTTNSTLLSKNLIKRSIYLLFSVGVTVWIFSYLFSVVSLDEVLNAIGKSSPYYLLLFLFFSMIMSIGRTWRYLLFLNISGHNTGRFAMFLVTLARNFFSDLLPARLGTLVYIYLVQARLGVPFDAAASSFALSFIFDILVLGLLVIGASLLVSSALISQGIMIAASLFALVVCTMVLLLLPTVLIWMGRRISRFSWIPETMRGRLERSLVATGAEINHIRSQKIYARALALSVVVRLGKYLSLYALLLAIVVPLGYAAGEFPFSKVFLGLCGAELSASLPISGIAGFGAYEGAWTLVFQMLGYGAKLSALTSVAHHLISQIYGYSLGAIAMITLLLPFFKGDFNNLSQRSVGQAVGHFWLRYAGLFFIIGLVYLVAFSHPSVGNADTKTDTPSTGQQANQSKLPAGRVVFTKSDGIYVKQLGGGSAKRILSNGTYPRWSPDGHKIAFVQGGRIGVHDMTDGSTTFLAQAENPRAVVFNDTGDSVFYTDGKVVYAVDIATRRTRKVASGKHFRELDVARAGVMLAVTAKERFGYYVYVIDTNSDRKKKISRGCSASLSPDGGSVTVNSSGHLTLDIFDRKTGKKNGAIDAPPGYKFDNQFWSNHPDWIVSVSEGDGGNIYAHQVSTNKAFPVTTSGGCNRPDLFIESDNR